MADINLRGKRWKEAANYGQIFVQLEKNEYCEGEQVNGQVFIDLSSAFPGNTLLLKVKGAEIVHFVDTESRIRDRSDGTRDVRYETVLRTEKAYVFNYLLPLYKWNTSDIISPGQYSFAFSFKLPVSIPTSFYQKMHRALAAIQYHIEPELKPFEELSYPLKYKQRFVIKHKQESLSAIEGFTSIKHLSSCCVRKGENVLKCNFDKSAYVPGEEARLNLVVDNTKSRSACSSVHLVLCQYLELRAKQQVNSFVFDVVMRDLDGIPSGCVRETQVTSLQLPSKQSGDFLLLNNNPDLKNLLLKEQPYGETISPSTNGKLITSRFALQILVHFNGFGIEDNVLMLPCDINMPSYEVASPKMDPSLRSLEVKEIANLLLSSKFEVNKMQVEEHKFEESDDSFPSSQGQKNEQVQENQPIIPEKKQSLDHIAMSTSMSVELPKDHFKGV